MGAATLRIASRVDEADLGKYKPQSLLPSAEVEE
jgi:hypothetical protein